MEISKVINSDAKKVTQPLIQGRITDEEIKRLTDFFSLLIQIDRKTRKEVLKNAN